MNANGMYIYQLVGHFWHVGCSKNKIFGSVLWSVWCASASAIIIPCLSIAQFSCSSNHIFWVLLLPCRCCTRDEISLNFWIKPLPKQEDITYEKQREWRCNETIRECTYGVNTGDSLWKSLGTWDMILVGVFVWHRTFELKPWKG